MSLLDTSDYLKSLKNMRNIVLVTIIAAFIICIIFAILFLKATSDNEKKIYVVTDVGTFLAQRHDYSVRQDFEIKNHVRIFFQNLMEGDQFTFLKNVDNALNLIDNDNGKRIYDQLQKGGFFEMYKRENAHTTIVFDSIKVKMTDRPYKAMVWFKQSIYWAGYSKDIPYSALMEIVEENRSEKNPFGLLITKFSFLEYNVDTRVKTPSDSLK